MCPTQMDTEAGMAGSINKIILIGNLGADPEIRSTSTGGEFVRLSVATSDSWRDKNTGERRERTEWHRVVIFDEFLGNLAKQYLRKGSKVYLVGQIQTRKWQDDAGEDKYTTEVVLRQYQGELTMLDGRSEGGPGGGGGSLDQQSDDYGGGIDGEGGGVGGGGGDIDDVPPF